jgi:hypothetical protein
LTLEASEEDEDPTGDEMASMVADDVSTLLTDSRDTHGDAIENQQHIADGWTWYLRGQGILGPDESITGSDAARMMAILKMSRSAVGEEIVDSDRDLAGYGSIAAADQVSRGVADIEDLQEYADE